MDEHDLKEKVNNNNSIRCHNNSQYHRNLSKSTDKFLCKIITEKDKKTGENIQYKCTKLLGSGGFANVYEVQDVITKEIFAIKITPKINLLKDNRREKLISEIKIHRKLDHENIVSFIRYFEDKDYVYILEEICENQTMENLLKRRKRLTEFEVAYYINQLLSALQYLHKKYVIHRDLKLSNLFLYKDLVLKLGDFGLATKLSHKNERKFTVCGTPNFIAPEVILARPVGYSFEVDIWAVGVMIYTLLVGKPPFETSDVKKTYKNIKMSFYEFPNEIVDEISSEAKNLIKKILVVSPKERLTIEEIFDHQFFKKFISLPKHLPIYCLINPPEDLYLEQYLNKENLNKIESSENNQSQTEKATTHTLKYQEIKDNFIDGFHFHSRTSNFSLKKKKIQK